MPRAARPRSSAARTMRPGPQPTSSSGPCEAVEHVASRPRSRARASRRRRAATRPSASPTLRSASAGRHRRRGAGRRARRRPRRTPRGCSRRPPDAPDAAATARAKPRVAGSRRPPPRASSARSTSRRVSQLLDRETCAERVRRAAGRRCRSATSGRRGSRRPGDRACPAPRSPRRRRVRSPHPCRRATARSPACNCGVSMPMSRVGSSSRSKRAAMRSIEGARMLGNDLEADVAGCRRGRRRSTGSAGRPGPCRRRRQRVGEAGRGDRQPRPRACTAGADAS